MKKVVLVFTLLLSFTFAFSQSLYLDPGKTIPTDDPNGIPAYSYSFGSTLHSVTIELEIGTSSSALALAVASGTLFKKMELKSYNGKKLDYTYVFSDVLLTSIQFSSGTTESLTLEYSSFRMK